MVMRIKLADLNRLFWWRAGSGDILGQGIEAAGQCRCICHCSLTPIVHHHISIEADIRFGSDQQKAHHGARLVSRTIQCVRAAFVCSIEVLS